MPADPSDPSDIRLRELLHQDLADDELHAETLRLLRRHPALEHARRETLRHAEEARAMLDPLPDGPAKDALQALCDSVAIRTM